MVQMRETPSTGKGFRSQGRALEWLRYCRDTLTMITGHLRKTEGGASEVGFLFRLSSPHHLSNRFFSGNRRRKRLVVTTFVTVTAFIVGSSEAATDEGVSGKKRRREALFGAASVYSIAITVYGIAASLPTFCCQRTHPSPLSG